MARKKKNGAADDIVDLVSLMPWWVGVVLALVFYVVLHSIASKPVGTLTAPGQAGSLALTAVWKGLATVGQYIFPVLCLLGAGISAYRRSQRKTLITSVGNASAADALNGITWQEFEILVGESFRLQGYQVTGNGGGGADGGIDLVLRKGSEKFLVQCKQWKAFSVGVAIVRELYGVMAAHGAAGGFVVTSGQFTKDAVEFAKGRNVELIDGARLQPMIKSAVAARDAGGKATRPTTESTPARPTASPSPAATVPPCPVCSKAMVRRTAKKGANAGQVFWGCTGYPACKGTRQL
jgi:restriction system protein